jgi:hypothetical protein
VRLVVGSSPELADHIAVDLVDILDVDFVVDNLAVDFVEDNTGEAAAIVPAVDWDRKLAASDIVDLDAAAVEQ